MKKRPVPISPGRRDFSNQAVIIILLLLVVVSIISLSFYLHTLANVKPKFVVNEGKTAGEVAITITKPPSELAVQQSDSQQRDSNPHNQP